ncbi:hypothetical protein Tco_1099956 [Tanacetum coccineum]|uniref:Uncharacterized protein n=1 Tax=Tanacetum coccineum TaxID=301880 RepID=A0ABQ5D8Z1_9ASTR
MRDSPAYKTYLAFATGTASPKKARKFKKPTYPSKKRTLVTVEKEEPELAKKIVSSQKPSRKQSTGGSSDGAGLQPKVLDEPKGKSVDTHKGTGLKPGVPNMSKADSSESDDDDPQQADDERTDSENQETNNDEEVIDNEFIHTPKDYVPTNDETNDESNEVNEKEYESISEELYGDVNVRLIDAETADEEKDDKEMTDAGHVDAEHVSIIQEGAGNQVKDDAQAT